MSVANEQAAGVLCCWEGTNLGDLKPADFEKWAANEFGIRATFAEVVTTLPSRRKDGRKIHGTGGRTDLLFYVHIDDVPKFAAKRFAYGIRWWQDVVSLENSRPGRSGRHIYAMEVVERYRTQEVARPYDEYGTDEED